jgi:phosphoribosylanthranilate isomerase
MGLKKQIKLNAVNNLSDARYAAGMEVEWIGFQVQQGMDRLVDVPTFDAITSWVAGPTFIAEVIHLNEAVFQYIEANYQSISTIQFQSVDDGFDFNKTSFQFIQHMELELPSDIENEILSKKIPAIQWLSVSFNPSSLWKNYKEQIQKCNLQFNILWNLSIDVNDIETLDAMGVNQLGLFGGTETRPGWMNIDSLIDIIESLEAE